MPARSGPTPAQRLGKYRDKRDFGHTPEPAGATPRRADPDGLVFVVQRHRASRLHYDFRLEMGGVLASWAVPKGPTLDPSVRRAAFHVEDHPIQYADFEGVIPSGEYGGGDVIVWDTGTWTPTKPQEAADPTRAVADGELHVGLHGHKLRGEFVLIRTRTDASGKEQWLLLHKHDDFAEEGWNPEDHPASVLSGRTNDEVKSDPDRMWRSDLPASRASIPLKSSTVAVSESELRQLARMGESGTWSVFGREVRLTNLDKVLFPDRGRTGRHPVTKRELVRYAARIAPVILPYLTRRPMNLHRFPDGSDANGFWQKALPAQAPEWIARWDNPDARGEEAGTYLVVDEAATLIWAANLGALEWHAWTSRVDHPQQPTYALVDLDPGTSTSWADLLVLARLHRTAFEHMGIQAWPKITGRRGIQIWVPIARGPGYDQVRSWVEQVSRSVGGVVPEMVSWKWSVGERGGRARLDYTQNAINKTLVAPYSPRAAPGAPVSVPITWEELDDPKLRPDRFTIRTVSRRLAEKGDVFAGALDCQQKLPDLA